MRKINVQILLTTEEYAQIQKEADKLGLTVPLFIKCTVLKDDIFWGVYKKLIAKVNALPVGTEFNIKSLFGVEWNMGINKEIKLKLGKTFFGHVNSQVVKNVECIGKDSSNIMWYKRIAVQENLGGYVMTKEEEVMEFLHQRVFDPILNSKEAPASLKSGVNLTIGRMNRLPAAKMVQYFWSTLATDNAIAFSEKLEAEGLPRFEDVSEEFRYKFDDEWLRK